MNEGRRGGAVMITSHGHNFETNDLWMWCNPLWLERVCRARFSTSSSFSSNKARFTLLQVAYQQQGENMCHSVRGVHSIVSHQLTSQVAWKWMEGVAFVEEWLGWCTPTPKGTVMQEVRSSFVLQLHLLEASPLLISVSISQINFHWHSQYVDGIELSGSGGDLRMRSQRRWNNGSVCVTVNNLRQSLQISGILQYLTHLNESVNAPIAMSTILAMWPWQYTTDDIWLVICRSIIDRLVHLRFWRKLCALLVSFVGLTYSICAPLTLNLHDK